MAEKPRNPLIFYGAVTQPIGNVLERIFDTDDYRLIGHVIPEGVQDPERYMRELSAMLDQLEERDNIITHEESKENSVFIPNVPLIKANEAGEDIANFAVFPVLRKIYLNREGEEIPGREIFVCEVRFKNGRVRQFEIRTSELTNLAKRIRKRFPEAIISSEQTSTAEKVIEAEFRAQTEHTPVQIYLTQAGWQCIEGQMVYVHDGIRFQNGYIVETGLDLPGAGIDEVECGKNFIRSLRLYAETPVMHTLSLFSLLGILYRCFRIAGYPPHFLLFINGRTGTLKTTIAKILYTQLSNNSYRDTPRRIDADTATSFEMGLVKSGCDTTTLYDDFAPAKTPQKKREMYNKLETLIRMAGDGSTKSRSNANLEDVRGTGVQGMVVVTGELKGKGSSSNLRCLYAEMKKGFASLDTVSWFQENPTAYTAMLNSFANYVGKNWNVIIGHIQQTFPKERTELAKTLDEKRIVDAAATLRITSDILQGFMTRFCCFPSDYAEQLCAEMKQSVVTVAQHSLEYSRDEAYSVTFIKTVHELMQIGIIRLHAVKPENTDELETFDGFFDDVALYFYLPAFYKRVLSYLEGTNRYYPLDPDEAADELFQDGISVPSANGTDCRGKVRWSKYWRVQLKNSNIKIKFIKIRKRIFEEVLNGRDIEELKKRSKDGE